MNVSVEIIPEKKIQGRRLGRHVEHDDRSRAFGIVRHTTGPLRSIRHPRHCPVFNQGDLGSCTGNAMAGARMTGPFWTPGTTLTEADAVKLYEVATHCDRIPGSYPPNDTGSSGLAVARAAQKMKLITSYHHAFGINEALYALSQGPVIIGIDWFDSFDEPPNGELAIADGAEVRGGHEMVLDVLDVENGRVGGHNSWGEDWGLDGAYWMTFGTFRRLLARRGDVVVPIL